jgi:hypothetical protein
MDSRPHGARKRRFAGSSSIQLSDIIKEIRPEPSHIQSEPVGSKSKKQAIKIGFAISSATTLR